MGIGSWVKKMFELNLDWGEHGGHCVEVWKCEPYCGEPCNVITGCYCCLCVICCSCCVVSKIWATSQGNENCGCLNHCLPVILPIIVWPVLYLIVDIIMEILGISSGFKTLIKIVLIILGLFELAWLCNVRSSTRFNLRKMWNIGNPKSNIGDWIMITCCAPCEFLQELRALPTRRDGVAGWDWFGQIQHSGFYCKSGPCCRVHYRSENDEFKSLYSSSPSSMTEY